MRGASWSSLDHKGRWKGLHYAARRFYAPVLLSANVLFDGRVEPYGVYFLEEAEELRVLVMCTVGVGVPEVVLYAVGPCYHEEQQVVAVLFHQMVEEAGSPVQRLL